MNTPASVPTENSAEQELPIDWVEAHGDYLFNLAVGQVRNVTIAEDLVQDTFLVALNGRNRFAGRSAPRTWLVGILRHKILDHFRKAGREKPVSQFISPSHSDDDAWTQSGAWLHEMADECAHPSRRMELAEFREQLERALGELPPRIAQVFELYEMQERPNREVCETMNITEGNLWVMLHRARRQLREHLTPWMEGHRNTGAPSTI